MTDADLTVTIDGAREVRDPRCYGLAIELFHRISAKSTSPANGAA